MHTVPRFLPLPAATVTGLALAALLASAHPADAQTYSYHEIINTEIGTPTLSPDDSYMDADGITNAGVVVGAVEVAPPTAYASPTEGYEYDTKSGAATLINYQASLGGPGITGVSGDGSQILGYYVGSDGNTVYFTDSSGSIADLPAPYGQPADGGSKNDAYYNGINSSGATVGLYDDGTEGENHNGFLRNTDGNFTSLVEPDSTTENPPDKIHGTEAEGINASGTIVGSYTYGFITRPDGRLLNLEKGFIQSAGGTYTSFALPGTNNSGIFGISDNGNLFGVYSEDQYRDTVGNFADVDGKIISGISVPGSLDQSTTLTGINDSGQISGYFQDEDGVYHGFYADFNPVPEASSLVSFGLLLLLGLGGLVTARKKSRIAAEARA